MLIGLTGKKRAGKDSVAARLVSEHGFVRLAFADALKAAALKADPLVDAGAEVHERLSAAVDEIGWEAAKEYGDVRGFIQRLGVAVREEVSASAWLDIVAAKAIDALAQGKSVVITDVRFPNELDLVAELDGFHVHIDRPGLVSDDSHASEMALEESYGLADATISNDSDLAHLKARTDEVVEVLRHL